MSFLKVIAALLLVVTSIKGSVVGPAFAHAPVVAPAISYTHAVPYNVPPFAASVNIFTRHLPPALHATPFAAVAAHAALPALHAPVLPGIIPQARSIHPPSFLHAHALAAPHLPHALAGPLPYALGAPLPHALAGPLPHAFGAPLPHSLAGPLPHALGVPLPHALAGPLPHSLGAPLPHALAGPLPHALGAPLPHAGPVPHALGGHLPHALGAPLPHTLAGPLPHAVAPPGIGAPLPHAHAHAVPAPGLAGPLPYAYGAPPVWRR